MDQIHEQIHIPVLKDKVIEFLDIKKGGYYLDGTIGFGGHTLAMLEAAQGDIFILGTDRDQDALKVAKKSIESKGYSHMVFLYHSNYSRVFDLIKGLGWDALDGALLDLGISSYQVDIPERGFSFHRDGPLDMRMDHTQKISAYELINSLSYEELKSIIREYGEDPFASRIAMKIVETRKKRTIKTTRELASVVLEAYPARFRRSARRHPATRTFQALRIAVNRELDELNSFLSGILDFFKPGGRLVIISFHSLEDRIVKHFFKREQRGCVCPPDQILCTCNHKPRLKILTKKPVVPDKGEIKQNKRARSAKLRAAEIL